MIKLTYREHTALKDIARYTRTPTKKRNGYSKIWTPKTNEKLKEKGLVDFVSDFVFITDLGLSALSEGDQ